MTRLARAESAIVNAVAVAVEKTAKKVEGHAKSDHDKYVRLPEGRKRYTKKERRVAYALQREALHSSGRYQNQTGTLTRSILALPAVVSFSREKVSADIVATAEYASYVELGTGRSRKFPFLHPALTRKGPELPGLIAAEIAKIGSV